MTTRRFGILGAIVTAGVAALLVIQHQSRTRLSEQDSVLLRQADRITQLEAENARLSNLVAAEVKNTPLPLRDQAHEVFRLRGEVGLLQEQTNELAQSLKENRQMLAQVAAQSGTNPVTQEERFTLRQTHTLDAMMALLNAIKNYATNHQGRFPGSFDQLAAAGELKATNFAGNLGMNDFELGQDGAVDPYGRKVILRLRVPIQKPGGGAVMVVGRITEEGVPSTTTWSVSP